MSKKINIKDIKSVVKSHSNKPSITNFQNILKSGNGNNVTKQGGLIINNIIKTIKNQTPKPSQRGFSTNRYVTNNNDYNQNVLDTNTNFNDNFNNDILYKVMGAKMSANNQVKNKYTTENKNSTLQLEGQSKANNTIDTKADIYQIVNGMNMSSSKEYRFTEQSNHIMINNEEEKPNTNTNTKKEFIKNKYKNLLDDYFTCFVSTR